MADAEQLVQVLEKDFEIQVPEPERLVLVAKDKLFRTVGDAGRYGVGRSLCDRTRYHSCTQELTGSCAPFQTFWQILPMPDSRRFSSNPGMAVLRPQFSHRTVSRTKN